MHSRLSKGTRGITAVLQSFFRPRLQTPVRAQAGWRHWILAGRYRCLCLNSRVQHWHDPASTPRLRRKKPEDSQGSLSQISGQAFDSLFASLSTPLRSSTHLFAKVLRSLQGLRPSGPDNTTSVSPRRLAGDCRTEFALRKQAWSSQRMSTMSGFKNHKETNAKHESQPKVRLEAAALLLCVPACFLFLGFSVELCVFTSWRRPGKGWAPD